MRDRKEYMKRYYIDNKERKKEQSKQWQRENPEQYKKYQIQYRLKNRGRARECAKQRRKNNPEYHRQYEKKEKRKEYKKQWAKNNPEKIKEMFKRWQEKNPEYYKEHSEQWRKDNLENHRQYMKHRRRTDLKFHLNCRMSSAIGESLRGNKNGRHWESLVGYTLSDLLNHLKKNIPKNCGWNDYLKGKLHIDHIIPMKAFEFKTSEDEEFKQCWSLDNLKLLTKEKNLRKHHSIQNPILLGLLINNLEREDKVNDSEFFTSKYKTCRSCKV